MFIPKKSVAGVSDYPEHSDIRESDWHVLASFWHPVAVAHEIGSKPVRQTLLDKGLVIYRTSKGVTVALDQCPHRGTRLSGGVIERNRLICPMHGLHFDASGACTKIPSMPYTQARIPDKLKLTVFQSVERYGFVWVCLKAEPRWALPEWPELEVEGRKRVYVPAGEWAASAGRHVENFNDIAHFPWVHLQSFGGKKTDPVPPYEVEQTESGLRFEITYTEGGNRFPDGVRARNRTVRYIYELTYPFSTLLHVAPEGSDFVHYFADAVCPVSAHRSRIFQVYTDTTGYPDFETWTAEALTINAEDKPLVESQTPVELPLNIAQEMSIPADRMSIAYRKGLVSRFGLGKLETE